MMNMMIALTWMELIRQDNEYDEKIYYFGLFIMYYHILSLINLNM